MATKFSFRTTSVLLLAAAVVAGLGALARIARAQDKPHLAGKWNFNQDQSDDASQKVHDAETSARTRGGGYPGGGGGYPGGGGGGYPGGGGGYPGGGYPGGGGIGFPGGGGGMGGGRRGGGNGMGQGTGLSSQDLEQMEQNPKILDITQDEKQVTISDDDGNSRNLYPDGKKHKETDSSGHSTSIETHWDGDRLVAESKLKSGKLTETYVLSQDGKQLRVTSQLDNSRLSAPLVIHRVYDSAAAAAKQ
jgi:hypothetical protein